MVDSNVKKVTLIDAWHTVLGSREQDDIITLLMLKLQWPIMTGYVVLYSIEIQKLQNNTDPCWNALARLLFCNECPFSSTFWLSMNYCMPHVSSDPITVHDLCKTFEPLTGAVCYLLNELLSTNWK